MNKTLKESLILIVAILLVIVTIGMNFISIMKFEILEYKYEDIKNKYQVEIEQKDYKIQVLEEHNLRLEEIIREEQFSNKQE